MSTQLSVALPRRGLTDFAATGAHSRTLPDIPAVARPPYLLAALLGLLAGIALAGSQGLLRLADAGPAAAIMLLAATGGALATAAFSRVVRLGQAVRARRMAARHRALLKRLLAEGREGLSTAPSGAPREAMHARCGLLALLLDDHAQAVSHFKQAAAEGEHPWVLNNAGVALARQGRADKAYLALKSAAAMWPSEPAVQLNLALLKLQRNDHKGALHHLRAAGEAAEQPCWQVLRASLEGALERPASAVGVMADAIGAMATPDAVALNAFGVALATEGHLRDAATMFDHAAARQPRLAAARANRGVTALLLGRLDQAARELREAVELAPENELVHINLGILLHRRRRYDDARHELQRVVQAGTATADAYHNLAQSYLEQHRYEEAAVTAEQAVGANPSSAAARINLGAALFYLKRFDAAREHLEQALREPDLLALAQHDLGLVYAVSGRLDPAVEALGEAIRLEPDDPEHRVALGYAYHISGQLREAYRCWNELVLDHRTARVCYHLGLCEYGLERFELAAEWLTEALALDPGLHQAHFPLGSAYAALDKPELAVTHWEHGLDGEPESPELLSNLGLAYYRLERVEEALSLLRRAYFVRPDDPSFCNNLALAYARAGRYDRAAEFFECAVDLTPNSVIARCNLGLAQYLAGQVDSALEQWTQASKVDPHYYLRRQRDDLKNTFDDVELRALPLDWQSRALAERPLTAGFVHRFLSEIPELPW